MRYKLGQCSFFCRLSLKCQNNNGQKFLESFQRSDPIYLPHGWGRRSRCVSKSKKQNHKKKKHCDGTASALQTDPECSNLDMDERNLTHSFFFFLAEDKRAEWRSGYCHVTLRNPRASPPLIKHYNGRRKLQTRSALCRGIQSPCNDPVTRRLPLP